MVNNRENRGQIQGKRDLVRDRAMFGIRDKSETVGLLMTSYWRRFIKML